MIRTLAALTLVGGLLTPAQDQDLESRIRDRVNKALDEDLKRMRESVLDAVRSEFGKKPSVAPSDFKADGTIDKALELVTEDLIKGHATFLASDDLEGRNAGYPGNDKATEYIADVMKKAGLTPGGDKDGDGKATYFQHFKVFGRKTRNCVGWLEGTDADLKKEFVVIGAHHDHVGTDEQGHWGRLGRAKADDKIWNGADDNGSGTSTTLAVIKAFGEGKIKTKRSVIFLTFSGEEGGLIGSAFYVKNPIAPIAQHVYMLNLDMVGRNPEKPMEIHGVGSADDDVIRKVVEAATEKSKLNAKLFDKVQLVGGDSDHTSFKDARVPFTFFFSGFHADYHRVTDTPDKLAYPNMVKVAKTSVHILTGIANADKRPVFKGRGGNDFPFEDPNPQVKPRRLLGFTPATVEEDEMKSWNLNKDQGAVKVDRVTAGGIGEKAGLAQGDVILSVGGSTLGKADPLADLRTVLGKVEGGKDVEIVVLREGKKQTLKARWEK